MSKNLEKYGWALFNMLKKKQYGQIALAMLIVLFVLALQYFMTPEVSHTSNVTASVLEQNFYTVKRIVDGDTFIYLDGEVERTVRLLGADTPETKDPRKPVECFGEEASKMTSRLIGGKVVRLEADSTALNKDMYGRELRYVYLPDGRLLNSYLIREGYAHVTLQSYFQRQQEFVNLENEARIAGRGLWAPEACN